MNFQDIVTEEFETNTETECINEGWFPITPFLAYSTFKKKIFNALNRNKVLQVFKKITSGEVTDKIKGAALSTKEKIRHDIGITGSNKESTVYKLTPEQISVLADIDNKYGRKLLNEIYIFRKNVLAPYQVIKRLIKTNKQVSFKDRYGISYEEYKSALESGRKKILKRKDFFTNTGNKTDKIGELNNALDDIKSAVADIEKGSTNLSDSILNKIYQELEVGEEELQGYTLAELKNITDELARNYRDLKDFINSDGESVPPEDIISTIERNIEIRSGKTDEVEDAVKEVSVKNLKKGNINIALAKYMLRKEVRNKIKEVDSNSYKKMYIELLKSLANKMSLRKKDTLHSAIGDKIAIEFTEKEKKVWGKLSTTKEDYSGNIEDYYQKISDTSFKDVKHIHKSDELVKAQQEIENEIKRFERKLAKVISVEDLSKLKKYRLINNLITVGEMKSPNELFKTPGELKQVTTDGMNDGDEEDTEDDNKENKEGYVSEEEFVKKIEEWSSVDIESINELNSVKKQADDLVTKMNSQGDEEVVKKYSAIIEKIKNRKITNDKEQENKYLYGEIIDASAIENFAKNILKKKYENVEEVKQDKSVFDKMVEKFTKEDPNAEDELQKINFLLSQVDRKFEASVDKIYSD